MILVTGGTGFLGRELVSRLIKRGLKVRVLARKEKEARRMFRKAEVVQGDVCTGRGLAEALRGVDTVIHLAGLVSYSLPRKELIRANTEGTKNLLAHCSRVKRFIFAGSVSAMGEIRGTADENHLCRPANPYGESKLLAEEAIIDSGINHVILRMAPMYGAGATSWMKNLRMMERGFPIPDTKNLTHLLHVSDAAQAFEKAMTKGFGTYLIADRKPVPFQTLVRKIMELLGKPAKTAPFWLVKIVAALKGIGPYLHVLTMNRHYNIRKAQKELGFDPKADMDKELKKMVEWYRKSSEVPVGVSEPGKRNGVKKGVAGSDV